MTFPPKTDRGLGKFRRMTLEEEVAQSVRLILTTRRGERPLRGKFGADLDRFAFEGMGATTQNLIRREVIDALTKWEPRAEDPEVTFQRREEAGKLVVNVSYRLAATLRRDLTQVEVDLS